MLNLNFDLDLCTQLYDYKDYQMVEVKYRKLKREFIEKYSNTIIQNYKILQKELKQNLEKKIQERKNTETRQRQNGVSFLERKTYRENQIQLEKNFAQKLNKKILPIENWLDYADMQQIKRVGIKNFLKIYYDRISSN